MQQRRKDHRGRTYLGAQIAFNNRCSTLDCLVTNLSAEGAMIAFAGTVAIPGEFDVSIPSKGESRRARVVWLEETRVGVRFLPANGNVVSIEAAIRLRRLEAEREALARRVAQLTEPV